jgi:Protein of unknown function (DUF2948)
MGADRMNNLKLIAFDAEDLAVLSAHLQDAVLKLEDIAYLPRQQRFAFIANRFNWATVGLHDGDHRKCFERCRTALRFERVLGAKVQGLDLANKNAVLCLLAMRFEPGEPPAGYITLVFAGGGGIRLQVECIEAELMDLGPSWRARAKPEHSNDPGTSKG